nr:protein hol1 [Quercus suber]
MGLGVLEDKWTKHVPGTATLEDEKTISHISDNLKRTADGIIFVPQPSNDPNDPMVRLPGHYVQYSQMRYTELQITMASELADRPSRLLHIHLVYDIPDRGDPIANAGCYVSCPLDMVYPVSITDIALLTGYHLLGVGLSGFVYVAAARVWGKRPMFLTGAVIMVISCAWCGRAGHNYDSFVAARFFQGVGLAPFEALVNSSVTDMYAVHERGKRMAFSNMCLFGGAFFTPVIVGKMTASLGWQWPFYFVAIFVGALIPFLYLFCPETAFDRESVMASNPRLPVLAEDTGSSLQMSLRDPVPGDMQGQKAMSTIAMDQASTETETRSPSYESGVGVLSGSSPSAKVNFLSMEKLRIFTGRKSHESFFKLLLRPFALFFHPVFVFACLIQGSLIAFTVMIGVVLALVFLQPPLSFNEVEDGYLYTGALIGSLLGFLAAGALGDSSTKFLTKRNGGIFEPEFRLVLVIPQLILGCTGLYGFGITAYDTARYGWFWPEFFFSFVVAGLVFGAVASAIYLAEAYNDIAIEGFTCLTIFKNLLCFAMTFKAFDWLASPGGIRHILIIGGSVQAGVCLLAIPMCTPPISLVKSCAGFSRMLTMSQGSMARKLAPSRHAMTSLPCYTCADA